MYDSKESVTTNTGGGLLINQKIAFLPQIIPAIIGKIYDR
jgi:hypothetical protein